MMTLLERLRRDMGWTQTRLSEVSGVSRVMLYYYENRHRVPSVGTMVRLAKAVKVKPRLLFDDFVGKSEQAS